MRTNHVREHIAAGNTAINAWVSIGNSYSVEILAHAGFDSVTIDMQHGMLGRDALVPMLQAISGSNATPLVRPTKPDMDEIGWILDAGAYGVIVPSVHDAKTAKRVVDACLYPPHGKRSFGPSRGLIYGGANYVAKAQETLMPWVMVESAQALANVEEICSVPGVYGIYVGPNDLALDMGYAAGGLVCDEMKVHVKHIRDVAASHGLATGIFCSSAAEAAYWANIGFTLVTPGNDAAMLRTSAHDRLAQIRLRHQEESPSSSQQDSVRGASSGGY